MNPRKLPIFDWLSGWVLWGGLWGSLVWAAAGLTPQAHAVDFDARSDITATGIFMDVNQSGFSSLNTSWDGFFAAGERLHANESGFQLEVEPDFRSLVGQSALLNPNDAAAISISAPPRYWNTEISLGSGPDREALLDFERMNLNYSSDQLTAYVGRKPVSLGVLKVMPVWNKFSHPLPGLSGLSLIYGVDGAGASAQFGQLAVNALSIEGATHPTSDVYAVEPIYYGDIAEVHLLLSQWFGETVGGVALAKNIAGATARLEWLSIGWGPTDADRQQQLGFGAEDALTSDLSVLAEGLYQSVGVTNPADYPFVQTSLYTPLKAAGYGYVQGSYSLSPYWKILGGSFTNVIDWGSILILRSTYSLSDSMDLQMEGDFPVARQNAEFATNSIDFSDGSYIGTNTLITAGVHMVF